MSLRFPVLLYFLLAVGSICAQHKDFRMTHYTSANGLLSDVAYAGFFDRNDYLWVCTDRGISRFDGTHFRHFTTGDGLPEEEIITAFEDDNGVIWVQPFQRETAFLLPGSNVFQNISCIIPPDTVLYDGHHTVFKLRNGGVAALNYHGQIRIIRNGKWVRTLPITGRGKTSFIWETPDGRIWSISDHCTVVFHTDGSWSIHERGLVVADFRVSGDKLCLITGTTTLSCRDLTNQRKPRDIDFKCTILRPGIMGDQLLIGEPDGTITLMDWFSGKRELFPLKTLFSSALEHKSGRIRVIFSPNEGMYVYVKDRPVYTPLIKVPMHLFADGNSIKILDNSYAIQFPANLSKTLPFSSWFDQRLTETVGHFTITYGSKSMCIDNRTGKEEVLPFGSVKDVFLLNDSLRLIASSGGILRFNVKTMAAPKILCKGRTTAVCSGPGGSIFIGLHRGLFELTCDGSLVDWSKRSELFTHRTADLACSNGIVWVATAGKGLIAICNGKAQLITGVGHLRKTPIVAAVCADQAGNLYVGFHNGLEQLRYTIRKDRNGNEKIVVTSRVKIKLQAYEGIKSLRYINGKVIGIGYNGVVELPDNFRPPRKVFHLLLNSVTINDSVMLLRNRYRLKPGNYDCSVTYSSVNFGEFPLEYRYRINKGEWKYTSGQQIRYTNLTPGVYRITIQVIDNYCQPCERRDLVLIIDYPVYQQGWFQLTMLILVIVLVFLLIRRRFRLKYRKEREQLRHETKLRELELAALKAQINPHFVFNCLNSIKALIYEEKLDDADIYLDRFADLFRNTLDGSLNQLHSIDSELAYLETYLELEQLRFKGRFVFASHVGPGVNRDLACIPPMLLQPYVENAIKHGVSRLKDRLGEIHIDIQKTGDSIKCTISDNGVGRAATSHEQRRHTSRGIALSARHAELYRIKVDITDNFPSGTTVQIVIPINQSTNLKQDEGSNS